MVSTEVLNDILQDTTSDWVDETYFDDDDDSEELQLSIAGEEHDQVGTIDLTGVNASSRPTTIKSIGSSLRSDGKRARLKQQHPSMYSFGGLTVRRDPMIESIIETRKFSIIENPYTRLAQVTSRAARVTQRSNPFEIRPSTAEEEEEPKDRISSALSEERTVSPATQGHDNERWEDGLIGEVEREKTQAVDKSCSQLYEETCKRLSICPCSMILRSLNTTTINLSSYGLGPRGCAALAVALVRNTTVLSLNLSQNNIGSDGMSHIHQVLMDNTYIEDYDLSFNNLGTKGIWKVAAAILQCAQLKTLNVAGNDLTASDIQILLLKIEDHANLQTLNISHNQLEEEGGINVAKWLSDNSTLLNLDLSWCSIRLTGAKALAKAIGDNNKLLFLDLSHNSFTNETIELITKSLSRNVILCELDLSGNQLISRFDGTVKDTPAVLITGKENQLYKMLVAAGTNQSLKIFRLGHNHIDARCLMIILEALSKLGNITLEELDFTGLTISGNQMTTVESLFANHHPRLTCFVGPVRQTSEHFANVLLNLINTYCIEKEISLAEMFHPNDGSNNTVSMVTYEQFLDGLRKAKIPFPIALIHNIMKYLGRDDEDGWIVLRSLIID